MSYLVRDHYNVEVRYCGIVETNMIPLHYTELFCFGVVPRASDAGRRTRSVQRHINQDTGNWKVGVRTGSTPEHHLLWLHVEELVESQLIVPVRVSLGEAQRITLDALRETGHDTLHGTSYVCVMRGESQSVGRGAEGPSERSRKTERPRRQKTKKFAQSKSETDTDA